MRGTRYEIQDTRYFVSGTKPIVQKNIPHSYGVCKYDLLTMHQYL